MTNLQRTVAQWSVAQLDAFWGCVDIVDVDAPQDTQCWLWRGDDWSAPESRGGARPQYRWRGQSYNVQRLAWLLAGNDDPRHTRALLIQCGHDACCNPVHLALADDDED